MTGPGVLNFTQFCFKYGYTDDYDMTDHTDLSPSGRRTKVGEKALEGRLLKRLGSNERGHAAYEAEILAGRVTDPSGKVTAEGLLRRKQAVTQAVTTSEISGMQSRVNFLCRVGKGKRGTLRPTIQREVDAMVRRAEMLGGSLEIPVK